MNTTGLDAVAAATEPRESLIRYLLSAYHLRDSHLRFGFEQLLQEPGAVAQDPYLEGTQPYRGDKSLLDLQREGVLDPGILRMFDPPQRALYSHQERAIRSAVQDQDNIVVATGTGSGKTECFTVPMMDHLLKNPQPGMQALILYPMNALVNDQVKRLRQLLCRQGSDHHLIRFGFYTSRTEKSTDKAIAALREELEGTDRNELLSLLPIRDQEALADRPHQDIVEAAQIRILQIQLVSREQIWQNPPQILVTNYSMLEHMLVRPMERSRIFESSPHFHMLIVDEAHTYNGSTGTEVSMLIKRFKSAVGISESGKVQAMATSASLGESTDPETKSKVIAFVSQLLGEPFKDVIWGERVSVEARLGKPYALPSGLQEAELYEFIDELSLPSVKATLSAWKQQLSYLVPDAVLENAEEEGRGEIHKFLWHALKGHPVMHRLIKILARGPQPWQQLAYSHELWSVPTSLQGEVMQEERLRLERALSNLVQLGTLARSNPNELPLLPVRLHLLFRSIEGLFACVNPACDDAARDPNSTQKGKFGRLYLNSQQECSCCSAPVIELSSCRKCGEAFGLGIVRNKQLQPLPRSLENLEDKSELYVVTTVPVENITSDEDTGEEDSSEESSDATEELVLNGGYRLSPLSLIKDGDKWGVRLKPCSDGESAWPLQWYRPAKSGNEEGGLLQCCPACGARKRLSGSIGRFVSFSDAPLEVLLDTLFELMPDSVDVRPGTTQRKLLTFSDGRQDAAFFASDFQRTHTENLYRQVVWHTYLRKQLDGVASIREVESGIADEFLTLSVPHPDPQPQRHHRSYVPHDENERDRKNRRDCLQWAGQRARELLLREFGLPSSRRFSIESLGMLACHVDAISQDLILKVVDNFSLEGEDAVQLAHVFLTSFTDQIRLLGAVDLEDASRYFPETGGVDGGMPGILGLTGRSRMYLKLRKAPKEKDTISFLPRLNDNRGEHPIQNRLLDYCRKFFGGLPSERSMNSLYQLLVNERILSVYNDGHQLEWDILTLSRSDDDWFSCPSCQQLFHIPLLKNLQPVTRKNAFSCPSYKCKGSLQTCVPNSLPINHYRNLISRKPLPLRSEEHTAQLETEDLSQRENRFRRGQINLLSSSTTLEMGVDIGELQVVAMRNFPPHVSNYQQRAGRAGRRTDGVAVTLMYGQRRPHDRYYFDQPSRLIAGSNQVPSLDPHNFDIQSRHIRAELLARFLRDRCDRGAEKVLIGEFLGFPEELSPVAEGIQSSLLQEFTEWLHEKAARDLIDYWIVLLESQATKDTVVNDFCRTLLDFCIEQQRDWNGLAEILDSVNLELTQLITKTDKDSKKRRDSLLRRQPAIQRQIQKINDRQLHEELATASILPIYGFPIDVVQLMTQENVNSFSYKGGHRLQRDRRLALSEYSPGQDIVVDDRVHRSVGVVRVGDLETNHYWCCKTCNFFIRESTEEAIEQRLGGDGVFSCPVCATDLRPGAKPSRAYKVPRAFTTDWAEVPKVTPFRKPVRQPTSQVFLAQADDDSETKRYQYFQITASQGGEFFLSNQGSSRLGRSAEKLGFPLCNRCGRDLTEQIKEMRKKKSAANGGANTSTALPHSHPITQGACKGRYEYVHLAHRFRSDLVKIRFTSEARPPAIHSSIRNLESGSGITSEMDDQSSFISDHSSGGLSFWRSLTYAILASSAQVIDVPRAELDGLFRPVENEPGVTELVLYDNVASGAGHSKKIAGKFQEVLERTLSLVSSCSCGSSCYDCLRTYTNQIFHDDLDRHLVRRFLLPIVEQLRPDDRQKAFAPHSSRVDGERVTLLLDRAVRMAGAETILALSSFRDPFNLAFLARTINGNRTGTPVSLILSSVPQRASDNSSRLLRRRLSQWIDENVLLLYTSKNVSEDSLCFSSTQSHRSAYQMRIGEDGCIVECLETRSTEGVHTVLERLRGWRDTGGLVDLKELNDPDTQIFFPERKWGTVSIDELRVRIGLEGLLNGHLLEKVEYTDRYLDNQDLYSAELFVELFKGPWLNPKTRMRVSTAETKDEFERRTDARRLRIQQALDTMPLDQPPELLWQPYGMTPHGKRLKHARELSIHLDDGEAFQILFDKGLDFVRPDQGACRVCEDSYVVINRSR